MNLAVRSSLTSHSATISTSGLPLKRPAWAPAMPPQPRMATRTFLLMGWVPGWWWEWFGLASRGDEEIAPGLQAALLALRRVVVETLVLELDRDAALVAGLDQDLEAARPAHLALAGDG